MSRWIHHRVAVCFGGTSNERPISLKTGRAIADALEATGHDVHRIDLDRAGVRALVDLDPDVVFVALHGPGGEDGTLQGLLELLSIPYTGSGVLGSALALDKVATKRMFAAFDVPTPAWAVVDPGATSLPAGLSAPCVVKPALEGSSVGVSVVRTADAFADAVAACATGRGEVLVEAFVDGRELSVGVFDGELLGIVEIDPADGFFDFAAKYERADTRYQLPALLDDDERRRVEAAALAAYRSVGARGVARVDVMLGATTGPMVLEVNTVPGMTERSLVPQMAAARGEAFDAFVARMLDAARLDAPTTKGDA